MTHLVIEYANPRDLNDSLAVRFRLLDNPVVPLWIDSLRQAIPQYSIDHPDRFYGFSNPQEESADALVRINCCIEEINAHHKIIDRRLNDVNDQDTLNYLHHIFEVYHGLLDRPHSFYLDAPQNVRNALANLNLLVHRCETVSRGSQPRHVVTWFGLPKSQTLNDDHYRWFTDYHEFGTVMLNYADIGKTLSDLAEDRDQYIAPGAFQPFRHYSADFVVRYWNTDRLLLEQKRAKIQAYYRDHMDFFGSWQPCYSAGNPPLAVIDQQLDLGDIASRQYVKSVTLD